MIHEFQTYLTSIKGCSVNTAESYGKDLRSFVAFMKETHKDARWSTITRDDLDEYIIYQGNRGLKATTTNRHLSAISSLYDYMKRQGYDVENPTRYESRRKEAETIINTIPLEDLKEAIKQSTGTIRIMIETLLHTGIRLQEMLDMKKQDLNTTDNTILIHGKGNKERTVHTSADNMAHLVEYCKQSAAHTPIFNLWTQREVRRGIYEALRPVSKARQLSPHAIRHTYATLMAQAGTNATTLMKMMGHTSLKTTQKYIDLGQQRTAEAYMNYQNAIA